MSRRIERIAWSLIVLLAIGVGNAAGAVHPGITLNPGDSITITAATPVVPAPSPTSGPTPTATATPPPSAPAIGCGSSLQARLDAAPPASIVNLTGCTFTNATASITKPLTIVSGTLKPSSQHAIAIRSNDVTFDGTVFDGGPGWMVDVLGVDRTTFRNTTFANAAETFIRLVGPGVDGVLIEGTTFRVTGKYSAVSADDNGPFGTDFRNVTIRNSTLDNGPRSSAWFGYELWGVASLVFEGNTFRGDDVHISIPRSDGAVIRNNTFDLTAVGWSPIELADIENVQVTGNTATGPSPNGCCTTWNAFVQLHPGSGAVRNITISGNRLTNFPALVNAAGDGHTIVDNCLNNVGRLQWGAFSGPVTIARNGPCS